MQQAPATMTRSSSSQGRNWRPAKRTLWQRGRRSKAPSSLTRSSRPQGCDWHQALGISAEMAKNTAQQTSTGPRYRDGGECSAAVREAQGREDVTGIRHWASRPRWRRIQRSRPALGLVTEMAVNAAHQCAIASGTTDAKGSIHWQRGRCKLARMRLASGTGPLGRDGGDYSAAVRHRRRHHGRCDWHPALTITPSSGSHGCDWHPALGLLAEMAENRALCLLAVVAAKAMQREQRALDCMAKVAKRR